MSKTDVNQAVLGTCGGCGSKNVRKASFMEEGIKHDCIVCNDCKHWG